MSPSLLSLKTTDGRFNRAMYWLYAFALPCGFAAVAILLLMVAFGGDDPSRSELPIWLVLLLLAVCIVVTFISIVASVKRLHDLNHRGWWLLLSFVPPLGLVLFIWLGFFRGTPGPNAYGPDPLRPAGQARRRWVLKGTEGQYADCEFQFDEPIVFGTDPRHSAVVMDARLYPDIEPAHCELRPPGGGRPAALYWPGAGARFQRRDESFNGRDLDLGGGLRFQVRPAD
jgi:uncharacterized membrane protein YhaH (DUF805 family)